MAPYNPNDPYGIGSYYGGDFSPNTPEQAAKAVADQNAVNNYYNTVNGRPTQPTPVKPPGGGGGGGGGGGNDEVKAGPSAAEIASEAYYNNQTRLANEAAAAEKLEKQTSARQYLKTLLTQYNMGSLAGQIEGLIQQSTNQDFLAEKVRETNEYKARFKGLLALQGRGNTDVRNEAEYLDLETEYRSAFNEAGLRNYLGTDGSQSEYDSIAELVGDYSVSVEEVKARIGDAQRVVADTPQEVRDSLQQYYNIDPLLMVEYTLDPARSQNKINSIANAAIVGGYAAKSGLQVDRFGSELVGDLAGDTDIAQEALNTRIQQGTALRDATKRLAQIEKSDLSDTEAFISASNVDAKAKKKVEGLQSRERARFSGSSAFDTRSLTNIKKI